MFSSYHFIWLFICAVLICFSLYTVNKKQIPFSKILNVAVAVCILSEMTKIISAIRFVPLNDGTGMVPYLELNHLPLHFCSLQIIFILLLRFAHLHDKSRHTLMAFMYPTCVLGALLALLMLSIYTSSITPEQSFTHPMAYQFYIFHVMLVFFGLCIYRYMGNRMVPKDYFSTMYIIVLLAVVSVYMNSVLAVPRYSAGNVVSIENHTNFFFTYVPPVPIHLTSVFEWLLYLVFIFFLSAFLVALMYLPVFRGRRI